MDKILVDRGKINDYMKTMYNHLDEFKNVLVEMEKDRDAIVWRGPAATTSLNYYNDMLSNYLLFANKMMEFIDYLNGYIEGYNSFIDEIKEEFKKMKEKYNIVDEDERDRV